MSKWIPDRKIWGGGLTAVVAWIIVQVTQAYLGVLLPPGTAEALAGGLGFATSYLLPPSAQDVIRRLDGAIIDLVAKDPSIPLVKAPQPPAPKTTVVSGMKQVLPVLLAIALLVPLAACGTVRTVESAAPSVTATPITQAVQAVKDMPAEEKWRLTCLAGDGLYIGYVAMAAAKMKDDTNVKVQAFYQGVKVMCADKPTDYASALVSLYAAFNAFKAALPKAA